MNPDNLAKDKLAHFLSLSKHKQEVLLSLLPERPSRLTHINWIIVLDTEIVDSSEPFILGFIKNCTRSRTHLEQCLMHFSPVFLNLALKYLEIKRVAVSESFLNNEELTTLFFPFGFFKDVRFTNFSAGILWLKGKICEPHLFTIFSWSKTWNHWLPREVSFVGLELSLILTLAQRISIITDPTSRSNLEKNFVTFSRMASKHCIKPGYLQIIHPALINENLRRYLHNYSGMISYLEELKKKYGEIFPYPDWNPKLYKYFPSTLQKILKTVIMCQRFRYENFRMRKDLMPIILTHVIHGFYDHEKSKIELWSEREKFYDEKSAHFVKSQCMKHGIYLPNLSSKNSTKRLEASLEASKWLVAIDLDIEMGKDRISDLRRDFVLQIIRWKTVKPLVSNNPHIVDTIVHSIRNSEHSFLDLKSGKITFNEKGEIVQGSTKRHKPF